MVKTRGRDEMDEEANRKPASASNGGQHPEEVSPSLPLFLDDGFPNSKAMNVWEYMEALTQAQWQTHLWYLYRTEPRILRTGGPSYLDKGAYLITEDDVLGRFGGKGFTLILKRDREKIYEHRFAIEALPKLKDDETLETPAEKAEKAVAERDSTLVSTLVADVIAQRDRAISAGQKFDVSTAITQSMALHSRASEAVIEMVVNQAKKIAGGGGSDGGLLETIKVLRDLGLIGTAAPAPNPFSQIKEMVELMRELGFEREGSGAATTNNPWVVLAQGIGQRMPDLIDRLAGVASDWRQGQEAITARAMAERGYKVRVIPGGDTPRPAAPAPAPVPPAPSSPPAPKGEEALLELYKHKLLQMFVNGVPGDEAAEAFDKLEPGFAQTVAALIRSKDPSLLTDPILGRMAQQPAAAQSFAADFLSYFDAATEEEETETTPVKH